MSSSIHTPQASQPPPAALPTLSTAVASASTKDPNNLHNTAPPPPSSSTKGAAVLPRDARFIALLLAANGASDAEEGVVRMLVEFAHRYTSDILSDSLLYAEHAKGVPLNPSGATVNLVPSIDDLRLAVQARQEAHHVPKEFLLQLATQINSNPLPPVPEVYGIRLPPQAQRLTAPNFSIVPRSEAGAAPPPTAPSTTATMMGRKAGTEATTDGDGEGEDDDEEEAGLFGSDDDEDEDDDDDDDEDDDDEDEDEDMEEVGGGELNGATPGGGGRTKRKSEHDDENDDDDDDDEFD